MIYGLIMAAAMWRQAYAHEAAVQDKAWKLTLFDPLGVKNFAVAAIMPVAATICALS